MSRGPGGGAGDICLFASCRWRTRNLISIIGSETGQRLRHLFFFFCQPTPYLNLGVSGSDNVANPEPLQ